MPVSCLPGARELSSGRTYSDSLRSHDLGSKVVSVVRCGCILPGMDTHALQDKRSEAEALLDQVRRLLAVGSAQTGAQEHHDLIKHVVVLRRALDRLSFRLRCENYGRSVFLTLKRSSPTLYSRDFFARRREISKLYSLRTRMQTFSLSFSPRRCR